MARAPSGTTFAPCVRSLFPIDSSTEARGLPVQTAQGIIVASMRVLEVVTSAEVARSRRQWPGL